MKRTFILAIASVMLWGCASAQQDGEDLSEAGKRMHAAFKRCTKEELSRENAVEQIDCMGKAEIQAGYESYQEDTPDIEEEVYIQNLEQDLMADRASAFEYAEGKIDKESYIAAIKKHWADTLKVDKKERAKGLNGYIDNS